MAKEKVMVTDLLKKHTWTGKALHYAYVAFVLKTTLYLSVLPVYILFMWGYNEPFGIAVSLIGLPMFALIEAFSVLIGGIIYFGLRKGIGW